MDVSTELTLDDLEPGIAVLTLRRPARLNALSWPLIDALHDALDEIARRDDVRVLLLTGAGRGFCSGLDIAGDDALGSELSVQEALRLQERVASLALALRALPQPVVAAVNGPAAGGGLALALAADVRVCTPDARFNVAFVRVGLSGCDVGVSYLLPRIVGLGLASELMLTGRAVDGEEALRIGLANRMVAPAQLLAASAELGRAIAANSPFGVRMTKQVLRRNLEASSLEAAIELENRTQVLATRTDDVREALAARTERRTPAFADR
jgi:enoyl-CoA hydratase